MDPPPPDDDPEPIGDAPGPWDGLLVGPENALAQAAAKGLARGDGEGSPLVILGAAGAGKTRLLRALAADRIARRPGASVALLSGEAFADACHEAAGAGSPEVWAELRMRFRGVDLLAIDDLTGIARSPLAVAELEPTLDDLDASGASVALTVRDDPGRRVEWPRRLADRLRVGLTVRLEPPGPESRRRFLLDRLRTLGLTASSEAVDLLAESADGYRTLEGWASRIALASRIDRRPIDRALAARLMEEDETSGPAATVAEVARLVARRFGLHPRDLRSGSRRAALVEARHLAILLAREITGESFSKLGKAFGDRDSKTIRHACRAASERLRSDPGLAAEAEAIRRRWHRDAPAEG
jgi:chromosomal replication initiator protein